MIKKLAYIMNKKEKIQIPFLIMEIIVGSVFETFGIAAIIPVINIMVDPNAIYDEGLIGKIYRLFHFQSIYQYVMALAIAIIVFFFAKNIYLLLIKSHQIIFTCNGQRTLTNRMMKGYFSQPYVFFTKKNVAELQRNVSADIGKCYRTVLAILNIITQGCIALALILFLLISDWMMTLLLLGLVSITNFVFLFFTRKLNLKFGQISRKQGEQVIQWINQSFSGIKEIKLFCSEEFFIEKIDNAYGESSSAESKTNILSSLPSIVMETVCICAIMMALILKLSAGENLSQFISSVAMLSLAAIRLIPSISNISSSISVVLFCKSSISGIYDELIELENTKKNYISNYANAKRFNFNSKLSVKEISFRYSNSERYILENVSLVIEKGQSVAFIGSSGSGKTTLADIILGILEPESGIVEVDGINIHSNIHGWYQQLGYIPQNIYLMDDTIRNNVAFGVETDEIDDIKVWEALKKAQLDDFVKQLPNGLNTNLGDRGVRCSGGQRQRIGIARALYNDPEFLILDEATSALDNETEKAVMEAIDGLKGHKTLLIIAHRLSTTKNCDIVFKVENKGIEIV